MKLFDYRYIAAALLSAALVGCSVEEPLAGIQQEQAPQVVQPAAAEAQHHLQLIQSRSYIRRTEQHKAKEHQQHRKDPVAKGSRRMPEPLGITGKFLEGDHHTVKYAPENKVPVCSVPYSCQKPHDRDVSYLLEFARTASAEGDINVIPEPASQRHMPSSPEFGYAL